MKNKLSHTSNFSEGGELFHTLEFGSRILVTIKVLQNLISYISTFLFPLLYG